LNLLLWEDHHTHNIEKKNQEIDVIRKGHTIEMKAITTRIQGVEAMMKFMLKQQNPDLDVNDIEEMMVHI